MVYTTHLSCNPKQLDSSKARAMIAHSKQERECHPLSCSFPRDLARNVDRQCFYRPQLDMNVDSHGELFPLQSPLLRESLLVSFPPLNYMLKFRGYSYRAEIRLENSKMIDIRYHLHATGLLAYDALCSTASIIQHVQGRIYQMLAISAQGTLAIQTQGAAYMCTRPLASVRSKCTISRCSLTRPQSGCHL